MLIWIIIGGAVVAIYVLYALLATPDNVGKNDLTMQGDAMARGGDMLLFVLLAVVVILIVTHQLGLR